MAEKNVSRAAERLRLSQPAVSHALTRLRADFGDDLLVRVARGMVPTGRAIELLPQIRATLEHARMLYQKPEQFDPKRAQGRLKLASTEFFEQLALPRIIPALREEAPQVILQAISAQGVLPKNEMEQGRIDLAVAGFFGELPEGFYKQKLCEDQFVCVTRKGLLAPGKSVTLEEYLALEHLLISPQGDLNGVVDVELAKTKKKRRVVAGISNFLTPAWVVAHSDLILTLPERLAMIYAQYLPLSVSNLPLKIPAITLVQVWHERTNRDPLHRWFRKLVFDSIHRAPEPIITKN